MLVRTLTALFAGVPCRRARIATFAALLVASVPACTQKTELPPRERSSIGVPGEEHTELFVDIADRLNRLEEFDSAQERGDLLLQINFWAKQPQPATAWQADPLVSSNAELVKRLGESQYQLADIGYVQECVLARDASKFARGGEFDDLKVATRLFDWTVRNIQLEAEPPADKAAPMRRPIEVLLTGRGRAAERAWVFALLARHQALDVVLLDVPSRPGRPLAAFAAEKDLFVFDPEIGLPIPGPGDKPVATLAELTADDVLLRKLDLDAEHVYPLKAADFAQATIAIECTPQSLSRRMKHLESRLTGRQRATLASAPNPLVKRLTAALPETKVAAWSVSLSAGDDAWLPDLAKRRGTTDGWLPLQFKITQQQIETDPDLAAEGKTKAVDHYVLLLARGRQFRGPWDGERSAKSAYMYSRTPESFVSKMTDADQRRVTVAAKQTADLWLGILQFEQADYSVAADFFSRLVDPAATSPWLPSARFNLARSYEALGKFTEAIATYEADDSAQSHGNRLRARALRARESAGATAAAPTDQAD